MADDRQYRQNPAVITLPKNSAEPILIWQASDGSMYAFPGGTSGLGAFNAAMKAEYGEKYIRNILGTVAQEGLNAVFSMAKLVPGEGVLVNAMVVGLKIMVKGLSQNVGDAIRGKELTGSDIAANFYGELFKISNYAGGGGGKDVMSKAYKYKKFITSNDLGISKFHFGKFSKGLDDKGKEIFDYAISGELGIFSFGKQAEKATVKYIKKKLGAKSQEVFEEYDISKYAQNWDVIDMENFERFLSQGMTPEQATFYVKQRDKGLNYTLETFRRNVEEETGFFQQGSSSAFYMANHYWVEASKAWNKSSKYRMSDILYGDVSGFVDLAESGYYATAAGVNAVFGFIGSIFGGGEELSKQIITTPIKISQTTQDVFSATALAGNFTYPSTTPVLDYYLSKNKQINPPPNANKQSQQKTTETSKRAIPNRSKSQQPVQIPRANPNSNVNNLPFFSQSNFY